MPHFHISKGIPSPISLPLGLGKHGLLLVSTVTCSLNISSEHSHAARSFCSSCPTRQILRFIQVLACFRTSLLSITDQFPWYEYTPCGLFILQLVTVWAILTLDTYEYHSYKYLSVNFCVKTCFPSLGFVLWSRAAGLCGLEFLEVSRGLYHFIPHQQSCPLILVVYGWCLIVVLTCISWQWQWLVTKFVGHLSILFRKNVYSSLLTVFELDCFLSSWWHISFLYAFQSSVYEILVLKQPLHLYECLQF